MNNNPFDFSANEHIFRQIKERLGIYRIEPFKINHLLLRPCRCKVLLVTDGGLDFGLGDFGLSTFVSVLQNDGRHYVKFDLTLAHRSSFVTDAQVQMGAPNIARSIKGFRFDNSGHFTDAMYDQVWLFGILAGGAGMSDAELKALSKFMNGGGGVFATGDHGDLGRSLCSKIIRVRSMRRWTDTATGEVSMSGSRRNDTNRVGHDAGTQFDDQSDDIPQTIQPKLYSSSLGVFWGETYPHPILCSPSGRIDVLPDHPHEGECIVPTDLGQTYIDGTPEYPLGIAPEIIATSTVPAGNTASTKQATQAHSFGAICAYDGHRAKVGRVVTDSTWHHFVNVNLIGELEEIFGDPSTAPEDPSKNREPVALPSTHGFLFSLAGQAAFAKIKHYFINIAVWISRPANIECYNRPIIWNLLYHHRVLEAATDNPNLILERTSLQTIYGIGSHARDVLGKIATPCRGLELVIGIVRQLYPQFAIDIDPWIPIKQNPHPPLPWFNINTLLNVGLGAGLVAMREKFGELEKAPDERIEKSILPVFMEGAQKGLELGVKSFKEDVDRFMHFRKEQSPYK